MTESKDRAQTTSNQGILGRAVQATTPKRVVVGLMVLGLVGSGSAALIQVFGSSTGTATVDQKALSASDGSTDYGAVAAPESFARTVTVDNNNQDDDVAHKIEVTQSTASGTTSNMNDWSTHVYDVTNSQTVTATRKDVEVSYDTSDNEVLFEVPSINNYGSQEGVVFGFDTDNDGNYDIQVDAASSGAAPDYYEHNGGSYYDDTYDWTQSSGEYDGVYYENPSQDISSDDSFVLSVDASRLGSNWSFNVMEDSGAFVKPRSEAGDGQNTDSVTTDIGTPVADVQATSTSTTSNTLNIVEDGTKNYAVIQEFGSQTPKDDYTSTVDVIPN